MELRQLRYFVALAEEASFTRAAERLHITQPPLSQQIKLLEQELGVVLVKRLARGAALTDSGKTLLAHARSLIDGSKAAVRETIETASGTIGAVRLGTINSALFSIMPMALRQLQKKFAALEVSVVELGSQAQVRAILRDELDLGVVHLTNPTVGLRLEKLLTEPVCAAVPVEHPLASRRRISLSALASNDFIFVAREVAPVSHDQMIATCVRAGFSPRIRHTAGHLATIVQMVSLGLGVALVPESLRGSGSRGVEFVRLTDKLAVIELFLASKQPGSSPLIRNVTDAMRNISLNRAAR